MTIVLMFYPHIMTRVLIPHPRIIMRVLALTINFLSTYLGFIVPTRASIEQHPSFGNYISAGLEISLVVAIDYTGNIR